MANSRSRLFKGPPLRVRIANGRYDAIPAEWRQVKASPTDAAVAWIAAMRLKLPHVPLPQACVLALRDPAGGKTDVLPQPRAAAALAGHSACERCPSATLPGKTQFALMFASRMILP